MARTYIQGNSEPQKFSDGAETTPTTSFWHIRIGNSKRTLCGFKYSGAVTTSKKRPAETERHKALCKSCVRLADGRDPVFDRPSEQKGSRDPASIGTRANPAHTAYGDWNRGQVVA